MPTLARFPLLLLALFASPAAAQSVGETLSVLTEANAERYVGPLARGLGHTLTAGFASSARPHAMFGFDLGVRVAAATFPTSDETFQVVLPTSVTYAGKTYTNPYEATNGGSSPTVAGKGTGAQLRPRPGSAYYADLLLAGKDPSAKEFTIDLPAGLDFPAAPLAVIEGAVGIGLGTQLMARFVPTVEVGELAGVDEIGDVSAFGFGVMHSLTHWFPLMEPFLDVSVVWGTQKMELGGYAEAKGSTLGVIASAAVGPLSVYAHEATYEADVDVDYVVSNPLGNPALPANGTCVAFRSELGWTRRLAVGAQLDLSRLRLSAEYGMGRYRTFSAKAALAG